MATTALLGFKGFEWKTDDGGPEFYFSEGTEVPTEAEWEEWLKKALDSQSYIGPPAKLEQMVNKPLLWLGTNEVRGKYIDHKPYLYGNPGEIRVRFQIIGCKAYEVCKQGFVMRRNPRLGRKLAAFNGEPIPVPGWVIEKVNEWTGTQFQAPLPSGKPKPVLKRR